MVTIDSLKSCDGPIGNDPHTKQTCADSTSGVREHPGAGTNREGRLTVTPRPGSRDAEPTGEERRTSYGWEARHEEKEESGVIEVQAVLARREEDKEETNEEPSPRRPRETKPETPPRFWRSVAWSGACLYLNEGIQGGGRTGEEGRMNKGEW
ncbi:hypothetical protein NDU88_002370 [Pleurodeles waltl]|uniref:Uncharacterized protein n=1 Tax=Pleurodeles waltl TaxID=8319 RepID=A0AAV7SDH2_PLEWA|nr:hypothetical protein NDU88_002370 [Pleurodeles waltl]